MSDSDTSNSDSGVESELESDSDTSWLDDITTCQNELELIVSQTEQMLFYITMIQKRIDGPSICFQGKVQPFSKWLTEWEDEMKHDTIHNITWGQFLIEKLAECIDA
jgi:hypothetical protein